MWLLFACTSDTMDSSIETELYTCADPSRRTEDGPYVQSTLGPDWNDQPYDADGDTQFASASLVVADFDSDGVPDVFVPHVLGHRLYLSGAGGWGLGELPELPELVVGGAAADYDGDGDPDLFVTVLHGANRLLRNEGGRFEDVTTESGLGLYEEDTTSATWADLDGDGDLDLLVSNHREDSTLPQEMLSGQMDPAHSNRAWRNDGGVFTDISDSFPQLWRDAFTFVSAWEDFDSDGTPDLYMANDFGPMATPNALFHGPQLAVGEEGLAVQAYSMGLALGELNGDGAPDLLVTSWEKVALLLSDGAGGWYRAGASLGVTLNDQQHASWSAQFADLDNDGDEDLLATFGELWMGRGDSEFMEENFGLNNDPGQPDAVWRNDGAQFTEVAPDWGLDQDGRGRSIELADLNGDGWLDVLKHEQGSPAKAFFARCGEQTWLQVDLDQGGMNPDAIGAVVRVGEQRRVVRAGGHGSFGSMPPTAHFGLGDAVEVDVEVTWPDGDVSTWTGLQANQRVRLER